MADVPVSLMSGRIRTLLISLNLAYAVLLLIAGLSPELPDAVPDIPDQGAHALAYGVQAGLLFPLFRVSSVAPVKAAALAIAAAFTYGAVVESLQLLQPSRRVEYRDLAANLVGACTAGIIAYLFESFRIVGDGR